MATKAWQARRGWPSLTRPNRAPRPQALFNQEIVATLERFREWMAQPLDDRRDQVRSWFHVVLLPHSNGSSRVFDSETVAVYLRQPGEHARFLTPEVLADREPLPIAGTPPPGIEPVTSRYILSRFVKRRRSGRIGPATAPGDEKDPFSLIGSQAGAQARYGTASSNRPAPTPRSPAPFLRWMRATWRHPVQ